MIKTKHLLDKVQTSDGIRVWIEPIGLTEDLKHWCRVNQVLSNLGPPRALWDWYIDHPDGYDYFRGRYHEWLAKGPYRQFLQQLACDAVKHPITLLHQGDDPQHNSATALFEFISELEAWCPREEENG